MFKKLILICTTLALLMPVAATQAASKKSHKRVASSATAKKYSINASKYKLAAKYSKAGTASSASPRASSRKKVHIARSGGKYYIQQANFAHSAPLDSFDGSGDLELASSKAMIVDQSNGEVLFAKNTNTPTPIASVTKLMTAMVMLDAKLPMDEILEISDADVDYLKGTSSRLTVGTHLSRTELLQLAIMASENRAAHALGGNYPGGINAFIAAMNKKAAVLGLVNTRFVDPTGLNSDNQSTAEDLVKMVHVAYQYPEIREASTTPSHQVWVNGRDYPVSFNNTNVLVRNGDINWTIGLSKTGYISEAGRCLVMQAEISGKSMIIVLLDSVGKNTRIGDAQRIRKWLEFTASNTKLKSS